MTIFQKLEFLKSIAPPVKFQKESFDKIDVRK